MVGVGDDRCKIKIGDWFHGLGLRFFDMGPVHIILIVFAKEELLC